MVAGCEVGRHRTFADVVVGCFAEVARTIVGGVGSNTVALEPGWNNCSELNMGCFAHVAEKREAHVEKLEEHKLYATFRLVDMKLAVQFQNILLEESIPVWNSQNCCLVVAIVPNVSQPSQYQNLDIKLTEFP